MFASFLGRLKLSHKFSVLASLFIVAALVPVTLYMLEAGKNLRAVEIERTGLPTVLTGLKVIQLTQQHRALSALVLGEKHGAQESRRVKQKEVDAALAQLSKLSDALANPAINDLLISATRDWEKLWNGVATGRLDIAQSYTLHTELVSKFLKIYDLIAEAYRLSLDPDNDSYLLIQAAFYQLPYLAEELGKARAIGAGMLARKAASAEDRLRLNAVISNLSYRLNQTITFFDKAGAANHNIQRVIGKNMDAMSEAAHQVIEMAQDRIIKTETLSYSSEQYVAIATAAIDQQFAINESSAKELTELLDEKIRHFHRQRWIMASSLAGLLAITGWISLLIARSVTTPLSKAIVVAEQVAQGKLIGNIDVGPPNEVGQLLRALDAMSNSLRAIVSDVSTSIDSINAVSSDIASGNADVSARIEAQASSLEETASAMDELTSTVKRNADNAGRANELVQSASGVAARGGEVVSRVIHTMGEIDDSSRKIVEIIAVIDGIAFQTNILALNAAVEAARAGAQGRGFAVVASEVRNLAHRSALAAKEIKNLIAHSVERVESGNKLASLAGAAMEDILKSVDGITGIMSEIAMASREQGMGIEQVNLAVSQMDETTQQNAALVEQTAAASESLKEQAQLLVNAISVFQLDERDVSVSPSSFNSTLKLSRRPSIMISGAV
ncbi:methyl-accepting chemotaxis protein [Pseudoduganella sp. RAF53_2]|uniref:methyl-accepting chemotaxis protein n=1 Tax=unclassified Pseudoduganella TaxID=2637179 RepID=UPI003F961EA5